MFIDQTISKRDKYGTRLNIKKNTLKMPRKAYIATSNASLDIEIHLDCV
jgi:hypothetical protein